MKFGSRHALRIALLIGVGASLAACDTLRNASGEGKQPPDEFAVVTKAPLIIPPDYNLRPPKPGAAPTNQLEPTQAAQEALFNNGDSTAAAANAIQGDYSQGEKLLLAEAGAQNADPSIRQDLISDATAMQSSSDSFTDDVLFWKDTTPPDQSVNADAEAAKVSARQAEGQTPAAASTGAAAKPADTNTTDSAAVYKDEKPQDQGKDSQDSGGWFDWF